MIEPALEEELEDDGSIAECAPEPDDVELAQIHLRRPRESRTFKPLAPVEDDAD